MPVQPRRPGRLPIRARRSGSGAPPPAVRTAARGQSADGATQRMRRAAERGAANAVPLPAHRAAQHQLVLGSRTDNGLGAHAPVPGPGANADDALAVHRAEIELEPE